MPVLGVAVAQVEHRQPLGEAVADLLRRQHPDPGGGKLDGQRDSVQLAAQRGDRRCVVRGQLEVGSCRRGAVHEQVDRLVVGDGLRRGHGRLLGEAERWHNDDVLPAEPEWPPAGQQEAEVRAGRAQSRHEVADRGEEVFAVVEHQQRGSVRDVVGERVDPPRPVGDLQAQCLGDGRAQQVGIGQVGQRHHPTSVAVGAPRPLDEPEGDPSLSHPARPHQGDDPRRGKVLANIGQQGPAAHERRVEGERLDGATLGAAHATRRPVVGAAPRGTGPSSLDLLGHHQHAATRLPADSGSAPSWILPVRTSSSRGRYPK